jgi:hypothetical protein
MNDHPIVARGQLLIAAPRRSPRRCVMLRPFAPIQSDHETL